MAKQPVAAPIGKSVADQRTGELFGSPRTMNGFGVIANPSSVATRSGIGPAATPTGTVTTSSVPLIATAGTGNSLNMTMFWALVLNPLPDILTTVPGGPDSGDGGHLPTLDAPPAQGDGPAIAVRRK